MAGSVNLPEGFVLNSPEESVLPEGFILDSQKPKDVEVDRVSNFDPRELFAILAGSPVDALTSVANILGAEINSPVGGSESIMSGLEAMQGPSELALTAGSSAILEPIAGAAGALQAINPLAEEGAGEKAVRATQDLAFKPREAGQESLENIIKSISNARVVIEIW